MTNPSLAEKAFRNASLSAEHWLPAIHDIWNAIPVNGESWETASLLFEALLNEYQRHSQKLSDNKESLRLAAKKAKTPFFKFCGVPESWSVAHQATLTGTEAFLSQMVGVYQASFSLKDPNFWRAPGTDVWRRYSSDVKRILDRWVFDWEIKDIGSGIPMMQAMLTAEREHWERIPVKDVTAASIVESDFFESYFKGDLARFFGVHVDTVGDYIREGVLDVHPDDHPSKKPNAKKVRPNGQSFLRLVKTEYSIRARDKNGRDKILAELKQVVRKSVVSR